MRERLDGAVQQRVDARVVQTAQLTLEPVVVQGSRGDASGGVFAHGWGLPVARAFAPEPGWTHRLSDDAVGYHRDMTFEQPEIDPNALAVDSLPDDLRVGIDTQDETSTAQLTTGDIALTGGESAAGDTADGLRMSAEEALQARGDTTWTARHADEVMDPPGPPSTS